MKLLIFVGVNVGGIAGWAVGEPFGIMTAFFPEWIGKRAGRLCWLVNTSVSQT